MALFCLLLFIAIGSSLGGQAPDPVDYIQQMLNAAGLKEGGDKAEQPKSLFEWLLLKECEIVENIKISAKNLVKELKAEVEQNCAALKDGKSLNSQSLINTEKKVTLALQKDGPKMVAYLERIEKEKQITVDGQQFVALFNILRQIVMEMSAGPAKDEAVFKQNLVPSKMVQLAIQFWRIHSNNVHGHPQKRREHPRRRRKRANGESLLVNSLAFIFVWFIMSKIIIDSVKNALGGIDEIFEEYFYRIVFGIAIILFCLFQNAQNDHGQSFQRAIQSILSKLRNGRRH